MRPLRELRTVSAALDGIAGGRVVTAADLLAQRLKALELQFADHGWQRILYLELIALEGAGLAEQDEQRMAAREQATETKMKQHLQLRGAGLPERKDKGDSQGKGRGKKGGKRSVWSSQAHKVRNKPPPA